MNKKIIDKIGSSKLFEESTKKILKDDIREIQKRQEEELGKIKRDIRNNIEKKDSKSKLLLTFLGI